MSVNFNIALLRSLKDPLMDSLKKLYDQLQEVVEGKREVKAFEGASEAHLVVGSLGMINARGARVIAETIEVLVIALQNPGDARFQNLVDLHQGLRAAQQGIRALESYLGALINGEDDQPVKLWTPWSRMVQVLGDHEPHPDALFFPAPVFDDESFQPVQANDLKMTVESARRRFDEGATQWANTDSALPAEAGLRQILTVVDELYNLRHRKGYQGYWLALSARVQAALLHAQQERDDKRPLGALLDQASVELRKFAEDQKRVSDDTLREVVLPLVNVRTLEWAPRHPVFANLDRRFGIRDFLRAAQQSADTEGQAKLEGFTQRHQEFKDNLNTVKVEWAKQLGTTDQPDKRNLMKGLAVLLQKRDAFPGDAAPHLLSALSHLSEHYTTRLGDKVPESLGAEVATLLVMTDAVIDRRGQVSAEFAQQCDLQKRRVILALAGKSEELGALPHATWDHQTRGEQTRQAMRHVVQEVRKDLARIEKILDDVLREREDSHDHLGEIDGHAKLALGALRIMNQAPAVRVLENLRDTALQFDRKGHVISEQEREHVTVGLGSLTMFLNAYESGDPRAGRLLAPALKTLFNEDLPLDDEGLVPSLVPSSSPVDHAFTPDLPDETDEVPVIPPRFDEPEPLPPLEPETVTPLDVPPELVDWETSLHAPVAVEPGTPSGAPAHDDAVAPPAPVDSHDQPGWDESNDAMIAEVFLEEALEALDTVRSNVTVLDRHPNDHEALTTVRRQFHTLKGSGRMAQFHRLGAVAWLIEERLNEVLEAGAPMTPALHEVIVMATDAITGWVTELSAEQQRPGRQEDDPLRVWVDGTPVQARLAEEHPAHAGETHDDIGPSFAVDDVLEAPATHEPAGPVPPAWPETHDGPQDSLDGAPSEEPVGPVPPAWPETHDAPQDPQDGVSPEAPTGPAPALPPSVDEPVRIGTLELSSHLFQLFSSDAREHVDLLNGDVAAWYLENGGWTIGESFVRSAHTLRSLGRTIGLPALAELGGLLETRAEQAFNAQEVLSVDTVEVIEDAVKGLRDMVSNLIKHHAEPVRDPELIERMQALIAQAPAPMVPPSHEGDVPGVPEAEEHPAPTDGSTAAAVEALVPEDPAPVVPEPDRAPPVQEPVGEAVHASEAHPPVTAPAVPAEIAEPHDPWDDALDALGTIAAQVQRLTAAFEALASQRR